ncbi:MAG TPA: malto-oligosyltrehalose trehalohydrolase [Gemmataceae bacterium]|nr:malto-oligosyltrehalose trehalohydrolase [Gemmataceae bacterium]
MEQRRCGVIVEAEGLVRWRVWAPRAERVELVLIDGTQRRRQAMQPEGQGYFSCSLPGIAEGQHYAYRLNNGPERPDPCSLWQPDGVHNPSAVVHPQRFTWTDQTWQGVLREDLVFYELHVGTFTPEGTFEAVIPRLPELRELGITALELMPIGQFPGPRNWGYDGVHLYAPQNSYGGPHGLRKLVDACHAHGLAIVLDVVYNHLGPEGNYLAEFGPYFTDRYRTSWGSALNYDGPGSDPVRDFILGNVRLWIADYHFDGLRLDAVHAIHDTRPRHLLREIKEVADAGVGRPVHIIAESLVNDVRMVRASEYGGHGLDAEWNEDFHHALHAYLTGERHGKYSDFGDVQCLHRVLEHTFHLNGIYSPYRDRRWGAPDENLPGDCFVIGVQNHDHVGNRPHGDRFAALVCPAKQRLAASLMLLSPYLPLLFMGEEYGEENPFPFFCSFHDRGLIENVRRGRRRDYGFAAGVEMADPQAESTFAAARLSWSWPEGSIRAGIRRLYADLLTARHRWPALRDYTHRTARLLSNDDSATILHLVRGVGGPEAELHAYFNLTDQIQPIPSRPAEGSVPLFRSEAACYHGVRMEEMSPAQLEAYECIVLGPPAWAIRMTQGL